ncbi:MAG: class I SAM-dependent methyltransferase [Planctomycetes bacterium]|nr:class I SAM-dependent methyltransferase [Planctomycetota bacterium]
MEMPGYYTEKLAAERLQRVYEIAPPRTRQYLEAEIRHVQGRLRPADVVLELGCGYGRVSVRLAEIAARVVGIDHASASIALARRLAAGEPRCEFFVMDAAALAFDDGAFDRVVCVQNGISAFALEPERLVREALRVTRPGGSVLVSSYAAGFWPERLRWFEAQAVAGLLGAIDRERTRDGVIACLDGFRSGTFTPTDFRALGARLGSEPEIAQVDGSSVFAAFVAPPSRASTRG